MTAPLHLNLVWLALGVVALVASLAVGALLIGRLARQPVDESQLTPTLELALVVVIALVGFGLLYWSLLG